VKAAGDPLALLLPGLQRAGARLTPLGFEPLNHPVERALERPDLAGAVRRHRLQGAEDVQLLHASRESLERREQRPQQDQIRHEHDHDAHGEDECLDQPDLGADADRG
jgi:hypothetical protein